MSLARWFDPTTDFLPSGMGLGFSNLPVMDSLIGSMERPMRPTCDVYTTEDGHTMIEMELPGMKKEDLQIEYIENRLSISGRSERDSGVVEGATWTKRERSSGYFKREFFVPKDMDTDKIETKFESGVLTVNLPQSSYKTATKKQIKIN
eukprot:CFRG0661T1